MDNARRDKLNETLKQINKNLGKKYFNFAESSPSAEVIPFGIPEIDAFFGGGIPRRKFTVDFGSEDTGKSTRALHLTANAQKNGLIVAYIDLERKFCKERAVDLGVDIKNLVLAQNIENAEESMDAIRTLAQNKAVDLIILDSIQAMSPKGEQETKKGKEKSIEADEMALLARKLGKFFRVVSADIFNANIGVYLIGQIRTNLGGFFAYADLSGGNALKHWMSLCIFSRKGQKSDFPVKKYKKEIETPDGTVKKTVNEVIGFDCVLKMVKSHISNSARENEDIHVPFYYATGFKPIVEEYVEEQNPKEDIIEEKQEIVEETTEVKKEEPKPKPKRGRKPKVKPNE